MKLILIIVLIYLLSSITEYIVHRFIMHNTTLFNFYTNHRLHHSATFKNMSLNKKYKNYKSLGPEENLCLSGWESGLVFCSVIFIITPISLKIVGEKIYSINGLIGFVFAILLCLYAKITWNTIHPYLHNESPSKCGKFTINDEKKINNNFFKWLMKNHKAHHIYKDNQKGNYNITLPGADFLFGTYKRVQNPNYNHN